MHSARRLGQGGKPPWLKTVLPQGSTYFQTKKNLAQRQLVTVCQEAKCPNIGECWNTGTATFMVLGDTCTRACRFCHIKTGNPQGFVDGAEPQRVADSVQVMGLNYAVITMVDRDDLPDGGAAHIAAVVRQVRMVRPQIKVELLTSDFKGELSALETLCAADPDVLAHNIETVARLTPRVRDRRATYRTSLQVLRNFKRCRTNLLSKSSLMLGLGETRREVEQTLHDLRAQEVDIVTIGQYMRPTRKHLSVKEYLPPSVFQELRTFALTLGFSAVVAAPLSRSSYRAAEVFATAQQHRHGTQKN